MCSTNVKQFIIGFKVLESIFLSQFVKLFNSDKYISFLEYRCDRPNCKCSKKNYRWYFEHGTICMLNACPKWNFRKNLYWPNKSKCSVNVHVSSNRSSINKVDGGNNNAYKGNLWNAVSPTDIKPCSKFSRPWNK